MQRRKTLVIGANGKIGHRLVANMESDGPGSVRAMARPGRISDALANTGAEIVEADLLGEFEHALEDVNAVVFTAGSGPSTGLDKTLMVDLWGAVRTVAACEEHGIERFVMVSSIGADDPLQGPESLQPYLAAKSGADAVLMRSTLDWTIVRPGRLTDDEATGFVRFSPPDDSRAIPRADVAECLRQILAAEGWNRRVQTVFGGKDGDVATTELASC